MRAHADPHRWFRQRLPAFVGGLLAEGEERGFLEHRAQCEDCRRAFDDFTASDEIALTERGAHIPAPMLARWPDARRELTGIERAMVRTHLKRCEECRGDLERAGHTPELEFIPALESEPSEGGWRAWLFGKQPRSGAAQMAESPPVPGTPASGAARGARSRVPGLDGERTRGRRNRPSGDWLPWALGGWATAATVAATTLVIYAPGPTLGPSEPAPGDVARTPPVPPAVAPGFVLDVLPPAGILRGTTRGPGDEVATIRIAPRSRFVHVTMPEMFLPDSATVSLRVVGPDGTTLLEVRRRYDELFHRRTLLFGDPAADLAPGDYRLVVHADSTGGSVVGEFRFRLMRSALSGSVTSRR